MKFLQQLFVFIGLALFSVAHAQTERVEWFRAVATDDSSTVLRQLLRGADPNAPDADGQPPIVLAARAESWKVLDALLAAPGIQVDARNRNDETALMMAVLRGNLTIAKRLMAKDADVNKPGWTPLHYAATSSNPDGVRLMLDAHAYLDAASPNGTTPLMMAAMYGSPESVKLLLEAGADATLENALGMTALDFARQGQRPDAIELLSAKANPVATTAARAAPQSGAAVGTIAPSVNVPGTARSHAQAASTPRPATAASAVKPASAPRGMW
jgi:uncharacterized protein